MLDQIKKLIDPIESPVKGGFNSGNEELDKYVVAVSDLQCIADWIPQKQIYTLVAHNGDIDVVCGYLSVSAIGYMIGNNAYQRKDRNSVLITLKK